MQSSRRRVEATVDRGYWLDRKEVERLIGEFFAANDPDYAERNKRKLVDPASREDSGGRDRIGRVWVRGLKVGLDNGGDSGRVGDVPEMGDTCPLPDPINLSAVLGLFAVEFDDEEAQYLHANIICGVPRRLLPAHLECTPSRVSAIRMRCCRKFQKIRRKFTRQDFSRFGSTRKTSFEEPLPGGGHVWSLTGIDPLFADIMSAARPYGFKTLTSAITAVLECCCGCAPEPTRKPLRRKIAATQK